MAWDEGIQSFGEYLYRLIDERGHTIRGFAPRLNVSHSMLSHIRKGLTPPPLKRMEQWADAFDLDGKDRENTSWIWRPWRAHQNAFCVCSR